MRVARFVADQRTMHRVPHTVTCAILGISISWFYKWFGRGPTEGAARRAALDAKVRELFKASQGTYGSPRIHADLLEAGETVSVNTVADSMRRRGLAGRKPKRRRGLTCQDKSAPKFPDLVQAAPAPNVKWCGDITEIPTDEGKLYFASVLDLHLRRLLASATSDHPDAALVCDAIKMAAAVRGGRSAIDGVISTLIADQPILQRVSRLSAESSGCPNRWEGSVHVSITPPRRRSSRPSNTRSCPGIISPPKPMHARWCGARTSTTPDADTARRH